MINNSCIPTINAIVCHNNDNVMPVSLLNHNNAQTVMYIIIQEREPSQSTDDFTAMSATANCTSEGSQPITSQDSVGVADGVDSETPGGATDEMSEEEANREQYARKRM